MPSLTGPLGNAKLIGGDLEAGLRRAGQILLPVAPAQLGLGQARPRLVEGHPSQPQRMGALDREAQPGMIEPAPAQTQRFRPATPGKSASTPCRD